MTKKTTATPPGCHPENSLSVNHLTIQVLTQTLTESSGSADQAGVQFLNLQQHPFNYSRTADQAGDQVLNLQIAPFRDYSGSADQAGVLFLNL